MYGVNDVWVNETVCADKEKGLLKDMCESSAEVTEYTGVDKVQDNNNACSCTAEPEVTEEAMYCAEQASASEPVFLDCSDSKTDHLDMHSIRRFWELGQGEGQIQEVQGRLKANLNFWRDVLEAPVQLLSV